MLSEQLICKMRFGYRIDSPVVVMAYESDLNASFPAFHCSDYEMRKLLACSSLMFERLTSINKAAQRLIDHIDSYVGIDVVTKTALTDLLVEIQCGNQKIQQYAQVGTEMPLTWKPVSA